MRLFLDTNVLVSALVSRGLCAELFVACLESHVLLTGQPVLRELERMLSGKFKLPPSVVKEYLDLLREVAEFAEGEHLSPPATPDPDDAPILACALAAKADLFVTGDKALLEMLAVESVPVVSPRECWERLTLPARS